MPKTSKAFDPLIEKLARQLENTQGEVYADLEGNVYNSEQYVERLREDQDFAIEQIQSSINAPQVIESRITPREQVTLARRVADYAKQHPDTHERLLRDFLKQNEVLRQTYTVEDWKSVAETLQYEFQIQTSVEDLDDAADAEEMKAEY